MRSHRIVSVLFAAILCSCDGGSGTTAPVGSVTPVSNPNSTAVFPSLVLHMLPNAVYEGMTNRIDIFAFDRDRAPVSTDEAVVTSSDPSVAAIVDSLVIPMTDASNRRWSQRQLTLRLLKSGTTTLRVTLGSVDRSFVFNVAAVAPSTTALVVDSFTVIEYPACGSGSGCHYLFYAPLLKLREPTGKASAEVIGVEFTVPTKSTGMCSYSLRYGPGESAHVNGIDPDPWGDNPDLLQPERNSGARRSGIRARPRAGLEGCGRAHRGDRHDPANGGESDPATAGDDGVAWCLLTRGAAGAAAALGVQHPEPARREDISSVITSLEIDAPSGEYATSGIQTGQTREFDLVWGSLSPGALQATAREAGAQGRVITAVAIDAGSVVYLSYGWERDKSTVYEAKVVAARFGTVARDATNLAGDGYIITAMGGNLTEGYLLVGTRVRGQVAPRPLRIATDSIPSQPNDPAGCSGACGAVVSLAREGYAITGGILGAHDGTSRVFNIFIGEK
jgi:hypothetical protein